MYQPLSSIFLQAYQSGQTLTFTRVPQKHYDGFLKFLEELGEEAGHRAECQVIHDSACPLHEQSYAMDRCLCITLSFHVKKYDPDATT